MAAHADRKGLLDPGDQGRAGPRTSLKAAHSETAAARPGVLSPTITRTLSSDRVLALRAAKARARRVLDDGFPAEGELPRGVLSGGPGSC